MKSIYMCVVKTVVGKTISIHHKACMGSSLACKFQISGAAEPVTSLNSW